MTTFSFSKRTKEVKASEIRRVFDLAGQLTNPVNLSIGQPDFDASLIFKQAAVKAIKEGFNRYTPTQGIEPLRRKIAQKLEKRNKIMAVPEEILITAGVSGGLFLSFAALFNSGDEIIIFDPYFVGYKQLAKFFGIEPRFIDTYPDFRPKTGKIKTAINKKTKAILINSPNNPTGAVWRKSEIESVVAIAKKHDLIIISDEIYEDFIYDGLENFSPARIYEKTIILNGFSKAYGVPGWRLGFARAPREIIQEMAKLQQYTFVCAPSFAQQAAIKALDADTTKQIRQDYQKKRNLLFNGLKNHFELVKPEGAFYFFVKTLFGSGNEFIDAAVKKNLLLVPGSAFSEKNSHFRISFAAKEKTILKGIKILKQLA